MTQSNGKISHDHGLEELISLNDHITHNSLQFQCNPYQDTKGTFHRTETTNTKICMGPQKTLNSENNLERQKHTWSYPNPRFQDVLQSFK